MQYRNNLKFKDMIIKVYFQKPNRTIRFDEQYNVRGFVYNMLGDKASKYHDKFSPFSVSFVQGGKMKQDKSGIIFEENPYIQISTTHNEIYEDFIESIENAIDNKTANLCGLYPIRYEDYLDFKCNKTFDVIKTISPILLKKDWYKGGEKRKINCKDENWLYELNKNCKEKLQHEGIEDNSFKIVIGNKDAMRTKMITIGGVFNPCTDGVMTVYGKENTRRKLYELGLGHSTGIGFGAIKIL